MSKNESRYGVAIGPTEPGDTSIFKSIAKSFNIPEEDCKIKSYQEYNFFSVEVPTYSISKTLCTYKSDGPTKITMVDIKNFDDNVKKIMLLFPSLYNDKRKSVNYSRATTKFRMTPRYPPNITTLIFLALMFSIQNKVEINRFNFSNCNIVKEEGFTNILEFFPKLKEINLSGNPVVFDDPKLTFGSAKIITDNPNDDFYQSTYKKGRIDESTVDNEEFIKEQPQLVFQSLYKETNITLDLFPPMKFNIDEFPTNGFMFHFFRLMWNDISSCFDYYSENAVFSIILQKNLKTEHFADFESNYLNNSPKHLCGNSGIIDALQKLFPSGFKANPTSMNCSDLGNNQYLVIIHGVFAMNDNTLFGFDRSFFIRYVNYIFKILNDNIFIREHPKIYD